MAEPAMDMSSGAGGRRGRSGGGGAARRAARSAVSLETAKYIERNIPNLDVLNEEALQIIEANAETVLAEIGVNFVDNPAALDRWREAGAEVEGERVRIPRGLARQLCATAPATFTQHARNSARNVEIGGRNLVMAPVYGPPLRALCQRRAPLRDDGRFPQFRETGLHVEMAAPFRRHGVRADRCGREQAPSGHVASAYDPVGQTLYGVGHGTRARRGFGRDVQTAVRGRFRGPEHGDDLAHQHQQPVDLRFGDDGRARGVCPRQPSLHHFTLYRRRRDGADHCRGHAHTGAGRGAGGRSV